jgi:hypothetical protein
LQEGVILAFVENVHRCTSMKVAISVENSYVAIICHGPRA